ncbi:MAG: serine/threonine protein phosphatase [Candidatus Babeliaceae bacterium]|nr:serine/threonine protein phosphatase [Candidatus Babeliaceae bacterium]
MRKLKLHLFVLFLLSVASTLLPETDFQKFENLIKSTYSTDNYQSKTGVLPIKTIEQNIDTCIKLMDEQRKKSTGWNANSCPSRYSDTSIVVEKRPLLKKGDTIIIFGDRHGDIGSTLALLKKIEKERGKPILGSESGFKILDPNITIVFLGDYADRGNWSIEVIDFVCRLYNENPKQVILIRGNHEEKELAQIYGLLQDILGKYQKENEKKAKTIFNMIVNKLFPRLPSLVLMGANDITTGISHYGAFCHAGLFIDYLSQAIFAHEAPFFDYLDLEDIANKRTILAHTIRKEFLNVLSLRLTDQKKLINSKYIDFLPWKDFSLRWLDYSPQPETCLNPGSRGSLATGKISKDVSDTLLSLINDFLKDEKQQIDYIFRGHQQPDFIPEIKAGHGVAILGREKQEKNTVLKQNDVLTFAVGPVGYLRLFKKTGSPFDGCGVITIGDRPGTWQCIGYAVSQGEIKKYLNNIGKPSNQ